MYGRREAKKQDGDCIDRYCTAKGKYQVEALVGRYTDSEHTMSKETVNVCGTHRNVLQRGGNLGISDKSNREVVRGIRSGVYLAKDKHSEALLRLNQFRKWYRDACQHIGEQVVAGHPAPPETVEGARKLLDDITEAEAEVEKAREHLQSFW